MSTLKKPFAAGDRVLVYGLGPSLEWVPAGVVTSHAWGTLTVRLEGFSKVVVVHPKQCRRLVKK